MILGDVITDNYTAIANNVVLFSDMAGIVAMMLISTVGIKFFPKNNMLIFGFILLLIGYVSQFLISINVVTIESYLWGLKDVGSAIGLWGMLLAIMSEIKCNNEKLTTTKV